jgi:ATP-dependent RNA helicase DDX54/DBP10
VRAEDKPAALLWLVREVVPQQQLTLVFAATRHHVEFLHQLLTKEGVNAACVYGSMDQVGWVCSLGTGREGAVGHTHQQLLYYMLSMGCLSGTSIC